MRLYGYTDEGAQPEDVVSKPLAEITLAASPDELRSMAAFLQFCAAEMERMDDIYDHVHLSDRVKSFEDSPHFVVVRLSP